MAEIINLRQFRKARERAEKEARAGENRVVFGRPKRAKTLAETRKALERDRHEGHRLTPDASTSGDDREA
ncbi:DUF4169 family protein [Methylobacterium sp. A54F]